MKKFHTSFHNFVFNCNEFNKTETEKIHVVFEQDFIKKFFNISILLVIWSFFASWLGSFFASTGILSILKNPIEIAHFLPFIIFYITNNILQFIFIYLKTKKIIKIPLYKIIISTIPFFGAFYLLGVFLYTEPLFFKALKKYLTFIKKRKNLIKLFQKENQD